MSIQGWEDAPDTFEMGETHLKELYGLAQAIGAKFIVKEVKTISKLFGHTTEAFKLIVALVDQQGEGLDKLELKSLKFHPNLQEAVFSLMKASKEWKVEDLFLNCALLGDDSTCWAALARYAGTGHIGTLLIYKDNMARARARMEDVKAVWEIAEKLNLGYYDVNGGIVIGGGWGEDPKTTWEEAYIISIL